MEKLTIKTRPRTANEAVSLGFLLAKQYFIILWLSILLAMLPVLLLAGLVGWRLHSWEWVLFIVWWAKPWTERPAVLALSRLVFGKTLHWQEILQDWRVALGHHLFAELSWRRLFAANRIMRHAVNLLEDVQGRALRDRLSYMRRDVIFHKNTTIMIGISLLESGLILTALLLLHNLLPENLLSGRETGGAVLLQPWFLGLLTVLALLALSIGSVFYVAVGFTGYLNQRIISEGWAIALDLRALAARLPLWLAVLCAAFLFAPHAQALTPLQAEADRVFVQQESHNPQVSPFVQKKAFKRAQNDNKAKNPAASGRNYFSGGDGLPAKIVIVALLIMLVLWVLQHSLRHKGTLSLTRHKRHSSPRAAEISIEQTKMQAGIAGNARALLQAGHKTAVLSLLYRGTLQALHRQFKIDYAHSDSEAECLLRTRGKAPPAVIEFMQALTETWQSAVYGAREPSSERLQHLIETFTGLWPK